MRERSSFCRMVAAYHADPRAWPASRQKAAVHAWLRPWNERVAVRPWLPIHPDRLSGSGRWSSSRPCHQVSPVPFSSSSRRRQVQRVAGPSPSQAGDPASPRRSPPRVVAPRHRKGETLSVRISPTLSKSGAALGFMRGFYLVALIHESRGVPHSADRRGQAPLALSCASCGP